MHEFWSIWKPSWSGQAWRVCHLIYLQTNKLACHTWMLAEGRRHPDLRCRSFITAAMAVAGVAALAHFPRPAPSGGTQKARWGLRMLSAAWQQRDMQLRGFECFIRCSKPVWTLHKKETLSLLHGKVNNLSFTLECYTISFRTVYFIKILEKLNKNNQHLCL